ncbi:hypothetical protein N7454_004134 [Penicillium verhagenii]|nr:hypothetical protein N7454_004134 [Penicillium verhagenii]
MLVYEDNITKILTLGDQCIPCCGSETFITATGLDNHALVILEANVSAKGQDNLLPNYVLIRVAGAPWWCDQ